MVVKCTGTFVFSPTCSHHVVQSTSRNAKRTLCTTPTDQNSRTALGLDERSGTRERTRLHGSRGSKGRVCSVRASVLPCFRTRPFACSLARFV